MEKFKNSKKVTLWLIIMLFFTVNWLSYSLYIRFDLSASGRFKLTSASKKILRNLPEKATIEAYFSNDISEAYMQPVKQLRDFLEEYSSSSRGRVKLVYLNPDDDEKIQQKARSLGIQPMPLGSVDRKKREVSKVFLSLVIYYEDKTQVIPDILRQSQALEYFLTANIYKMAHPGEHTVGLLETDSEFSKDSRDNPFHSLEILDRSLSSFYGNMMPVKADVDEIPSNISVLFVSDPKKLTEIEKFNLDQYIMRGGKLILAMNGLDINFNNLIATAKTPDTLAFFKNYGIDIKPDLVFDAKNYIPFRQPVNVIQTIELPYPVWLAASEEFLSQDSLMTQNFQFIVFPWASSVSIESARIKDSQITPLASSSPVSWTKSDGLYISPEILKDSLDNVPDKSTMAKQSLAFHIKGKFNSFYSGKPLPQGKKNYISESINPAEIVVVSSPFTFTNNIQPIHIGQNLNINFFLSILDIMNGLDELVKSRNRSQMVSPAIGPIDLWMKNIIVFLNFLLPLVFIVGYAILRIIGRKKVSALTYTSQKNESISTGESHV
ncbi:MAG: Gldg family protein [Spirochaetia bacterium]|nr:Gldg family protein [Spirochaetia bacterium]